MLDFFRKLFGSDASSDASSNAPSQGTTTAPLSDQQIQSIIHNQNIQD